MGGEHEGALRWEGAQEPPLGEVWRGLEAADHAERSEQGRQGCDDHLDDCLDDVLLHSLK